MDDLISWEDDFVIIGTPSMNHKQKLQKTQDPSTSACPICFKQFPSDEIQEHANSCLNIAEREADPFSISMSIEEQEALIRKQREEEDYKLVLQLLEEEKRASMQIKEQSSVMDLKCTICGRIADVDSILFLDGCSHIYCKSCLKSYVVEKIELVLCSEICCRHEACKKPLGVTDLKEILNEKEFEEYEKATVQEVLDRNEGKYIKCPNKDCNVVVEKAPSIELEEIKEEMGPNGQKLSKEALIHKSEYRFRCRECQTEFCSSCFTTPYHIGFTCEQFKLYQTAKHCRFCGSQLTANNTGKFQDKIATLTDVCNSEECVDKRKLACVSKLKCGHLCNGVRGEKKCAPCLHEDCVAGGTQTSSDYCNICWVEELGTAPCVQLDCGHYFHYECAKRKIVAGWSTSRITFGFLECPLCKKFMKHPSLLNELQPFLNLYETVKKLALERLQLLNLTNTDEITKQESRWYKDPAGYAMHKYSYYPCFKCKKPYFGGEKNCEANNNEEFDPKDLLCGSCCEFSAQAKCDKHGDQFIEYKCRFCCNIAAWFCFGTTHFCEPCHRQSNVMINKPKNQLPPCTCNVKHPPNGEEFLLGCSLCRLLKHNCF